MKRLKHLANLVGLSIYIVLGAAACAASVAGAVLAFDDFVFQVNVPRAYLIATAVGSIVCYALYCGHADHIKNSLDYLAEVHPIAGWTVAIGASAFLALVIFYAPPKKPAESHAPIMTEPTPAPVAGMKVITEPEEAVISGDQLAAAPSMVESPSMRLENDIFALALLPYPLGGAQEFTRSNYPPVDPCELNGAFSKEALSACLVDIRKHPNRTGTGGPAYESTGSKRRGDLPPRLRGRTNSPLDIRPVR